MLKDKVIIVTGGSGLIGREIVNDVLKKGGITINAEFNLETNFDVGTLRFDITDPNSIKEGLKCVFEKYEKIDGIVNCAYPRTSDWGEKFEDVEYSSWQKNVDMQLNPLFLITQECLKYMKKGASFVNIGSIYGVVGNDFTIYENTQMTSPAAYSAIKAGVINFTRYIASYVGHKGIRANCVSPGGVFNNQDTIFVENYSHKVPLKRMAQSSEIAPAVSFLLSDEASYITGHNLIVDGGWCAI
jgi:NAD(P)-dependent dehydrogenase (short-subunit alcohol dehydrogenase family)